jgi:F-type H+-transporting ATPase subunit delta
MAKTSIGLARRYARTFFSVCEPPQLKAISQALTELAALWHSDPQLRLLIKNPAVALAERRQVLADISQLVLPGNQKLANFLALLLENKRIDCISSIADAFSKLLDELQNMLALEVTSAFELGSAERDRLSQRIESDYGALATVNWLVDPLLIGGLRIKAGDILLDASLQTVLNNAQQELMK